jgi:hypothetical protein
MHHLLFVNIASILGHWQVNPAYMDIVKILVGSIAWIGGLTGFMWWREKQRSSVRS